MPRGPIGHRNAEENRGGRTYPDRVIKDFFAKLDQRLPYVVDEVDRVITWSNENLPVAKLMGDKIALQDLKLKAAKVLFSKAPDRLTDSDGFDLPPTEIRIIAPVHKDPNGTSTEIQTDSSSV